MEKRNYEKKVITQLKTIDSKIITDLSRINEEIENYYKSFLTSRIPQGEGNDFDDQFALFSSDLQNPILPQDEANELEHDLTKDELLNALKGFQPDKTPRDDDFTKEFYIMKPFLNFYGATSWILSTKPFKQANCLYLREEELSRSHQKMKTILWS